MKHSVTALVLSALLLTGCTSTQYAGVAAGSGLGGMFGSSIGGIFGGPRGHDIGGAIGMIAGGIAGAAITGNTADGNDQASVDVSRRTSRRADSAPTAYTYSPYNCLEVTKVYLKDANNNMRLDAGEHATLTFDVYNRGNETLYDIAPIVSCDNRRVVISPTAIVSELDPNRGFRYKAEIIAPNRLRQDNLTFTVAFGGGERKTVVKTFNVPVGRR